MPETNIEKVVAVITAIRTQDAETALQYVDPRFMQHYPCIGDGVEGLRSYIVDSSPDQLELTIVRTIEDGPFVITQLKSELSGEHMFAVYRFHDGLIAEHWAFSSPDSPPNQSGHTQVDGPDAPKNLKDTDANKSFVRKYYETFHLSGNHEQNATFFTGDVMIRHEPGVRDGLGEFLRDVGVLMKSRTIDEVKLLLGQGDLVFIAAKGTHEEKPCAYIDLYRVENQKIVEHWGFPQMIPPQSESKNKNGML